MSKDGKAMCQMCKGGFVNMNNTCTFDSTKCLAGTTADEEGKICRNCDEGCSTCTFVNKTMMCEKCMDGYNKKTDSSRFCLSEKCKNNTVYRKGISAAGLAVQDCFPCKTGC